MRFMCATEADGGKLASFQGFRGRGVRDGTQEDKRGERGGVVLLELMIQWHTWNPNIATGLS